MKNSPFFFIFVFGLLALAPVYALNDAQRDETGSAVLVTGGADTVNRSLVSGETPMKTGSIESGEAFTFPAKEVTAAAGSAARISR